MEVYISLKNILKLFTNNTSVKPVTRDMCIWQTFANCYALRVILEVFNYEA
jgi:hypothetical protein